jgi:hypothetical protein
MPHHSHYTYITLGMDDGNYDGLPGTKTPSKQIPTYVTCTSCDKEAELTPK